MSTERNEQFISRRTVVTGAAWAVPAVALAVGTPLAAASGVGSVTLAQFDTGDPYSLAFVVFLDGPSVPSTAAVTYTVTGDPYIIDPSDTLYVPVDEYAGGVFSVFGDNISGADITASIVVSVEGVLSNQITFVHFAVPAGG